MHRTRKQLDAGLAAIRESPRDHGMLTWIAYRPAAGERVVVDSGALDVVVGLVGDTWHQRPSSRTPDRSPHPEMQLTLMNARVIELVAGERDRWAMAGDQLYVDLDLATDNLPPDTHLQIGGAVIVVTAQPHTSCAKFTDRFGSDASRWINAPTGRALNLRGINARVVEPGQVHRGDAICKQASFVARPVGARTTTLR
jgi:MOSC domain-containing protein YiiM